MWLGYFEDGHCWNRKEFLSFHHRIFSSWELMAVRSQLVCSPYADWLPLTSLIPCLFSLSRSLEVPATYSRILFLQSRCFPGCSWICWEQWSCKMAQTAAPPKHCSVPEVEKSSNLHACGLLTKVAQLLIADVTIKALFFCSKEGPGTPILPYSGLSMNALTDLLELFWKKSPHQHRTVCSSDSSYLEWLLESICFLK